MKGDDKKRQLEKLAFDEIRRVGGNENRYPVRELCEKIFPKSKI